MPFVRIWVHYVWATKNREKILYDPYRDIFFDHIKENARLKNIYLDRVNGYYEHVHCLVSLRSSQTVEKIAQIIKGESSFWFNNRSGFNSRKLEWQDDYFAVSVSESGVNRLRSYIDNQVAHHRKKTYIEEYDEFVNKYGFQKFG